MPPRLLAKPVNLTRLLAAKQPLRYKFPTPALYSLASIYTKSKAAENPKAADDAKSKKPLNPQKAESSVRYPANSNN